LGFGYRQNVLQDAAQVVLDTVVTEAQNAQAVCGQNAIPFLIVFFLISMHRAVTFHDKPGGAAVKISDESVYDLPTPEVQPLQLIISQAFLKPRFRRCHRPPHPAGECLLFRVPLRPDDFAVFHNHCLLLPASSSSYVFILTLPSQGRVGACAGVRYIPPAF
jgi:hypothetical protein